MYRFNGIGDDIATRKPRERELGQLSLVQSLEPTNNAFLLKYVSYGMLLRYSYQIDLPSVPIVIASLK